MAWKKCQEGVYNGFSIGGNIIEKIGNSIEKLRLIEISVVDRPANPEALFSVVKFDDSGKEIEKVTEEIDMEEPIKYGNIFTAAYVLDLATQLVDLYDWYFYAKKDVSNIVSALNSLKELAKQILNEDQTKKFELITQRIEASEANKNINKSEVNDAFVKGLDNLWAIDYYLDAKKHV
jgi:hypothetical protein